MGSNVYSAALSGMNAAQFGMSTTQHNIANVSTPGYSRQQIVLNARSSQASGAGFVGQGVDVTGVKRLYDQFLSNQVMLQEGQASYLNTYLSSVSQVNSLLSNSTSGVAAALDGFFAATNMLANNPASMPSRQTVLSSAQTAVNVFHAVDQTLTDLASGLSGQISNSVQSINSYATQIAALNGSIKSAIAVGQGQQPNDLQDQRDQLINLLNKEIKVSVQQQSDGSSNVFIGSGQALVVSDKAMSLQVTQSANDPTKTDVVYINNGKTNSIQQSSLQGGNLGAFITFRDQTLQPAQNALGRVVLAFANSVNTQNQMGQDLNGVQGASLMNEAPAFVIGGSGNTGTGVVVPVVQNIAALTGSDYQLKFDGVNHTLVRLSDNAVTQLGPTVPISKVVDGIKIDVTGAMNNSDVFLIRPTANAARDIAMLTSDMTKVAAASLVLASASKPNINTGSAVITPGTVNGPLPLDPNLQVPVKITFSSAIPATVPASFTYSASYTPVSPAGSAAVVTPATPYVPGAPISYNGWTASISGTPKAGDSFSVLPNTNGTGDGRNALLTGALQSKNLIGSGGAVATSSLIGAFSQLVSSVGSKTNELTVLSTAQNSMVTQTITAQQSVSGVNLDEEAANLMQYQRAYQAAAKSMQIANTMFDALLTLGR